MVHRYCLLTIDHDNITKPEPYQALYTFVNQYSGDPGRSRNPDNMFFHTAYAHTLPHTVGSPTATNDRNVGPCCMRFEDSPNQQIRIAGFGSVFFW